MLMSCIVALSYFVMSLPYAILIPLLFSQQKTVHISHVTLALILGCYPFGQAIGSPIFGYLSDHFGRKKMLSISLLGISVTQLLSGSAIYFDCFYWLIMTRFATGVFEGNISIARAVVSNLCNTKEKKQKGFGILNAASNIAWIIGPIVGAGASNPNFVSWFNNSTPFYIGTCLSLLSFLIIILFFKEPNKINSTKQIGLSTILGGISNIKNIRTNFYQSSYSSLMPITFLLMVGIDIFYQFLPIFLAIKFTFSTTLVAYTIAIIAMFNAITNLFCIDKVGQRSNFFKIMTLSTFILIISIAAIIFTSKDYYVFLLAPIIGTCMAFSLTNSLVLFSQSVKEDNQGEMMGIIISFRTLANVFIGIAFGYTIKHYINVPYIFAVITIVLALFLIYIKRQPIIVINDAERLRSSSTSVI